MRALPSLSVSRSAIWLGLGIASLATTACGGGAGPADAGAKAQSTAVNAAAAAAGPTASAVAAETPASASSEPAPAVSSAMASTAAATPPANKSAKALLSVSAARATVTNTATANTGSSAGSSVGVSVAAAPTTTAMAAVSGTSSPTVTAAATTASGTAPVYTGPITISKGGSYSGNWESKDPALPAVSITTTDPVTIQNCNIRSVGPGIQSVVSGTQVTVRNCKGQMNTPNVAGKSAGRFLSLYGPRSAVAENNEVTGGLGFYVDGGGRGADLIRFRYNKQSNVDGRQSDGKGGFAATFSIGQFAQLNNVQGIKDGEISWNQVINLPWQSRVEDNINLYLTRGLATRRFPVQNNYIQGAYPANPLKDGFSGGGIIVDGSSKSAATAAAYISIVGNQVVSTSNYGIAISAGIGNEIRANRVVSTGLLPSGEKIASANVGLYIWDINQNSASGSFSGNTAAGNSMYWLNKNGQRNDAWFPDCAAGGCATNLSIAANSLTVLNTGAALAAGVAKANAALEDVELANWLARLNAAGLKLGKLN